MKFIVDAHLPAGLCSLQRFDLSFDFPLFFVACKA